MCNIIMKRVTGFITFFFILITELAISFYPRVNLWVGENLILECRVAGGKRREQETVVWHRKRDLTMGEIISNGDTMVLENGKIKLEKTVFEDLTIYKI